MSKSDQTRISWQESGIFSCPRNLGSGQLGFVLRVSSFNTKVGQLASFNLVDIGKFERNRLVIFGLLVVWFL